MPTNCVIAEVDAVSGAASFPPNAMQLSIFLAFENAA
jgi:hypothetical protein